MYCPGIQRFPSDETLREVLPQASTLIDDSLAIQQGLGIPRPDEEGVRWANSLEIDLWLATGIDRHVFVPELVAELGLKLQNLADASGYPWSSSAWQRLLTDRREGWHQRGGLPTL